MANHSTMRLINISTPQGFFRWQPAAWLRVSGADAFTFLQGQFTNDLRRLERDPAVYGLWLTVKGKVLGDSFVLRAKSPGAYWIGSYATPAVVLCDRLASFIIADDVEVEDVTAGWTALSWLGTAPAGIDGTAAGGEGVCFRGRRSRAENWEWVFPAAEGPALAAKLDGSAEMDAGVVARLRIEERIPMIPEDLGPGDLPNEAGLEEEAISYTKGCYLGQEVMARLKSMGQVRRTLVRIALDAAAMPSLPAPLFRGARQVGEWRSAAADPRGGFIGLAMVSRLPFTSEPAAGLSLAPDGIPVIRLLDTP